jgi:lysophospholipase L1-like esterase
MKSRVLRRCLAAVILIAGIGVVRPASAVAAPTVALDSVLIVMDVSGSMSEADKNGTIKFEGAKAGVASLVQELPGNARVGLMTYPSDTDCGEPRLVQPIEPLNRGGLVQAVSSLPNPNGNTPTATALEQATKVLQAENGKGTIVLVSDGLANCNREPCPVAQDLAKQGVDITINTVGFAIDDEGRSQLQCIADATGGRAVTVDTGSQLGDELAQQMVPSLAVTASFPGAEVPITASSAPVTVTIANTGSVTAQGVRVAISAQDTSVFLGIVSPVVEVGNIAKGGTPTTVAWAVPITPQLAGKTVGLKVRVTAQNSSPLNRSGQFAVVSTAGSPIRSGSQLSGVTSALVMGDSFSSGDGAYSSQDGYVNNPVHGAPADCHQSAAMYADVLFPNQVTNLACSGDVTGNIDSWGQHSRPTQLALLQKELDAHKTFDAVFLTIGGNDVGFADIAKYCAIQHLLSQPIGGPNAPGLNPCAADPHSAVFASEMNLLQATKDNLVFTYLDIAQTFARKGQPTPPIIVSGYPMMVPYNATLRRMCASGLTDLAASLTQLGYYADFQRALNAAVAFAVQEAHDTYHVPVYFVSNTEDAFQPDHSVCSKLPYVNPPTVSNMTGITKDTAFHPNLSGHQAWALAIARWAERPEVKLEQATAVTRGSAVTVFTLGPASRLDAARQNQIGFIGNTTITVDNLRPGSPVIATMESSPTYVGYVHADDQGRATIQATLDDRLQPGWHTLVLGVVNSDGSPEVRRVRVYLMRPVPWTLMGLAAGGLVLLFVGVIRQRRTQVPVR